MVWVFLFFVFKNQCLVHKRYPINVYVTGECADYGLELLIFQGVALGRLSLCRDIGDKSSGEI